MSDLAAPRRRPVIRAGSTIGALGLVFVLLTSGLGLNGRIAASSNSCAVSPQGRPGCAPQSSITDSKLVRSASQTFNGSWRAFQPWPLDRYGALFLWDPTIHGALLFGGASSNPNNGVVSDATWTFNGTNWTQLYPVTSPPILSTYFTYTALVYDSASKSAILFGPDLRNQTWEFKNGSWAQLTVGGTVPPRGSVSAFAGDPPAGYIVGVGVTTCGRYSCAKDWAFKSGVWTQLNLNSVPWVTSSSTMTYDAHSSKIILFGASNSQSGTYNQTWGFSGGNWTQLHPAGSPPAGGTIAYDSTTGQDILWEYSGSYGFANGSWFRIHNSPTNRQGPLTRLINDPIRGGVSYLSTNGIWTYANGTWSFEFGNPNVPWSYAARSPADAAIGRILVYDSSLHAPVTFGRIGYGYGTTEAWEFSNASWKLLDRRAPDTNGVGAGAFDPSTGCIVLFGGSAAVTYSGGGIASLSNATWFYCNGKWTQQVWSNCSGFPQPMYGMSMAYDSAVGHIVMFGGYGYLGPLTFSKGNLNETWELVHRCWVRIYGATPPSARQGAALSYDSADGYLVLYSGFRGSGLGGAGSPLGDTWIFNGTKWTQVSIGASTPPPRSYTATTDDPALGGVVLFGGLGYGGILNDTWVYASGKWSQLNLKGPAPQIRYGESMVYVPSANGVFMDWGTTTQSSYFVGHMNPIFVAAPGPWFLV